MTYLLRMKISLLSLLCLASLSYGQINSEYEAPVQRAVTIELDELDVPRIVAGSREDAAYALGFLHGRERFFQMDLSRRNASGRLSELAGEATLGQDQAMRRWNFDAVADEVMASFTETERTIGEAYTLGVNDGLASLPSRPPEYFFVNAEPEPWTLKSSVLVTFTLVDQLSHGGRDERWNGAARATFSEEVFGFLHPRGGRLDAPMVGGPAPRAPIPSADELDLRGALEGWPASDDQRGAAPTLAPGFVTRGSNNWAIGGARTGLGAAMLATDPHLGLQLPNVWYRAQLEWEADGERHMAVGITLPGFPVVIMGSNGHLAWGMTNVHGDFEDRVVLPVDYEPVRRIETIIVRGRAEPVEYTVLDSEWGPVVETNDYNETRLASRWTGAMPEANNFAIFSMHEARTLEEGLDIAAAWKSAPQNVVIASADGRTGWTMSGYLPKRTGFDGTEPKEWKTGSVGWDGELPAAMRPRVIRDAAGYVFTANNRVGSLEQVAPIGTWFPSGDRAHRIREVIEESPRMDEGDMLALQLDTRTRRHDAWRDLVLATIPQDTEDELLRKARAVVTEWSGRADLDDTSHVLVRSIERAVSSRVWAPFQELVRRADPGASRWARYAADVALRLLEERPEHLLSPAFPSWDALVIDAVREVATNTEAHYVGGMRAAWAEANEASIKHPIALIAGNLMPGLSAPEDPLPGDWPAVRVAGSNFGASVRIVVAPGHEERGLCHMPGGQAGNPTDPDFLSGHASWVKGEPTPLLPGEPVEIITLTPRADGPDGG